MADGVHTVSDVFERLLLEVAKRGRAEADRDFFKKDNEVMMSDLAGIKDKLADTERRLGRMRLVLSDICEALAEGKSPRVLRKLRETAQSELIRARV